jgi:hypothetical protein
VSVALDQAIDAQIEHLLPQEIAGAYKALCTLVMVQTAVAIRTRVRRKEDAQGKQIARRWLESGTDGVLSFSDCCCALDVSEDEARCGLRRLADGRLDKSITRVSAGVP